MLARAYNSWLAERFCRVSPRLQGVALLPVALHLLRQRPAARRALPTARFLTPEPRSRIRLAAPDQPLLLAPPQRSRLRVRRLEVERHLGPLAAPVGGALLDGGMPGNAGGGKPPSELRARMRGLASRLVSVSCISRLRVTLSAGLTAMLSPSRRRRSLSVVAAVPPALALLVAAPLWGNRDL